MHAMTNHASGGTLVISLDLEGAGGENHSTLDEGLLATIDALLGILRDARMAATWASCQPAACRAVSDVLAETIGHEIAVRVAVEPSGEVGVRRLRELARQVQSAERAGYEITTLLADTIPEAESLAHMCRVGITAVGLANRSQAAIAPSWLERVGQLFSRSVEAPPQPRLLRYGLWEVPATIHRPAGQAALRRTLETAAACGDVLHVNFQTPQICRGRAGGLKVVEALVQTAFELRKEHRLTIRTIADLVARLRAERVSTPAQSILRRAA
jgi:hypothetical protein